MALKLKCKDYGFECDFNIEGEFSESQVKILKEHFEEKHGIDYSKEVVAQMIMNKDHS
ncbi:MAG: DUF1059 domain-containing protein [Nitrosopumilus sp.]|jgi:predicted small metal-binding protein|nr:DUF1059 domain-containing protein [Nitrosopumilus sp.]MBT3573680.1 DUF1059 domain-containing protein [Nitrosopumilus sp.]MBT3861822.1 DUF1059 domain-containing protein [Nitrosopumilus sp.]MBT3955799.1 DUF1059 domain-containing protein [Nitrosopumilus sp.]MBT4299170.1 DUF1059 domain-containing protein [Nitrosopumilus sp.]